MDSRTGEVYSEAMAKHLTKKVRKRLVEIDGRPEDIRRVSRAVKKQNKADLKKRKLRANRRKAVNNSRKKNR